MDLHRALSIAAGDVGLERRNQIPRRLSCMDIRGSLSFSWAFLIYFQRIRQCRFRGLHLRRSYREYGGGRHACLLLSGEISNYSLIEKEEEFLEYYFGCCLACCPLERERKRKRMINRAVVKLESKHVWRRSKEEGRMVEDLLFDGKEVSPRIERTIKNLCKLMQSIEFNLGFLIR